MCHLKDGKPLNKAMNGSAGDQGQHLKHFFLINLSICCRPVELLSDKTSPEKVGSDGGNLKSRRAELLNSNYKQAYTQAAPHIHPTLDVSLTIFCFYLCDYLESVL